MRFRDRREAGQELAERLAPLHEADPIVIALPRGGLPVGYEIARALDAPLEIWVVRKLGAPMQPELGLGAIAEDGALYVDDSLVSTLGVSEPELQRVLARESAEVERRIVRYREGRPRVQVEGRTVILVDDGIATGGTVHAAARSIRGQRPARLILAVPVAATQSLSQLADEVDEVVCLTPTPDLFAIGAWYDDFRQLEDEDVLELLRRRREEQPARPEEGPAARP